MGKAGLKRATLAAVLILGACAAPPTVPTQPPRQPPPPPPAVTAPPSAAPAAAPTPTHDRCGADQLQWLVGRSKLEIPIPLEPSRRRVLCATCPMTREYNVFRQTILFDAASGRVTSVACN